LEIDSRSTRSWFGFEIFFSSKATSPPALSRRRWGLARDEFENLQKETIEKIKKQHLFTPEKLVETKLPLPSPEGEGAWRVTSLKICKKKQSRRSKKQRLFTPEKLVEIKLAPPL